MKIGFLTDKSGPDYIGGYEARIFEFAKGLSSRHDVSIFRGMAPPTDSTSNIRFVQISPGLPGKPATGRRSLLHSLSFSASSLLVDIHERDLDVLIVQSIPYAHLYALRSIRSRISAKVILDVSEAWGLHRETHPILSKLVSAIVKSSIHVGIQHSDLVIANSSVTAHGLTRYFGVNESMIKVIPSGVHFTERDDSSSNRLTGLDRQADIVTLGRLVDIKRHEDLLEALALLKLRHGWDGLALVIGDGPRRAELLRRSKNLGLDKNVRFTGLVPENQKRALLESGRVFVLCSLREGLSVSTLEAMAHGLVPVVAVPRTPDVFGVADLVDDEVNGLYFPAMNVERLAYQIGRLLGDESLAASLSRASRSRAMRFSWAACTDKLEDAIRPLTLG